MKRRIDLNNYLQNGISHSNAGNSKLGNVDKTGRCYHVTQQTWCKEPVFNRDIASFRHMMLCRLCIEFNVVILFSVTMPNHTHDVFLSDSWENISNVLKSLNSAVSKYVYKKDPKRKEKGKPIFNYRPNYSIVTTVNYLFFLGRYCLWNVEQLENEGRFVPYSCFWMFEKGHFSEPYKKDIYKDLFGFEASELLGFYKTHSKSEVFEVSKTLFSDWTQEMNDEVFLVEPHQRIQASTSAITAITAARVSSATTAT